MTRRFLLSLAAMFLLTIFSAFITGELLDTLTTANAGLVTLGILMGTLATCGFLLVFEEMIGETVA